MVILLGSKNPSKVRSLNLALEELGMNEIEIITVDAQSLVPFVPLIYKVQRETLDEAIELKLHKKTC